MKSFELNLPGGTGRYWKPTVSLAGAVVFAVGLLIIACVLLISWQAGRAQASTSMVAEDPPVELRESPGQAATDAADSARAKLRCPECGVIQSIRSSEAAGDKPPVYLTTIRFDDGSTRVLTDSNLAHWRIGEHITFIGGPAAPRQ